MKFSINYNGSVPLRDRIVKEIVAELEVHGHVLTSMSNELNFIINLTTFDNPKAVLRKAQNEFVISISTLSNELDDQRSVCYGMLVKTLSNLLLCIKENGEHAPEIYCITPEVGYYHFSYSPGKIYESMLPVINARMMITNRLTANLPAAYCKTAVTEKLKHYGGVLDSLGVLPAPFPLTDLLSQENIDHLYRLFKIKGLSYGNLSAREDIPEIGTDTFWMTARGVDKAHLKGPGEDILLVTGYDPENGEIVVSVPAEHNPRMRVSVDAIEHTLIYQAFPEVGAILHVHAWMKDIPSTHQNFPCGTLNLAEDVVALLKTTDQPGRAVVGLKNHGLTITGPDLDDIFSRIEGKLFKEVPMIP
ncbi:MAG: class II aldolase/adducin family protein [Bacteroidetes bacterium]|nr:class II aldolase/adducin family protein [Bacteroidota bacterium]